MSDNWIVLIPKDPVFVPNKASQQAAIDQLTELAPEAEEIEIKASDHIQLFDCGANLERISCPSCDRELDTEWWEERMIDDYVDGGFQLRDYPMPCCGAFHSLNALRYDWPQGFARFGIEAMNPNIGKLSDHEIQGFERILGAPVLAIYQHI